LINLTNNAIKFTREGNVRIDIQLNQIDSENVVVRFAVSDTGIGISEELRQKLFEPFNQADASTSRQFGGTGLGLSISRRLVELMGGEIGLKNREGAGSIFWFTAVLGKQAEGVALAEQGSEVDSQKSPVSTVAMAARRKFKILLAEDNLVNQTVALKLMEKKGYVADLAENGLEAIEALRVKSYDLVLMDCQMPEMDGFIATRQIRQNDSLVSRCDLPIVALTANAMQGDREKCLEAGMNDYLAKPIDAAALVEMLQKWLVDDR
jgi:CheY-like chemotaxis protein